jgi:hypothetical protein
MRDYWLTKDLLQAVGIGYGLLAIIAFAIALIAPKAWWAKLLAVLGVGFVLSFPLRQGLEERRAQQEQVDLAKARYARAKALFDKRCETAGEKIYRTVEGVEGIFVMKPRTEDINFDQQFKLDDPYGYAGKGESYIRLFIRGRSTVPTKVGEIVPSEKIVSYKFVEVTNRGGNELYRYTTSMSKDDSERVTRNGGGLVPISKEMVPSRSARYGITWEDISTNEDRQSWIAGSSQKVIDMQTNEVIGELIGYMFDRGLGNMAGGRSPWSAARENACPPLNEKTFYFFDRVIKPAQEPKK